MRRQRATQLSASEGHVELHILQFSHLCREGSAHSGIAPLQPIHVGEFAQFGRNRPTQKLCIPCVKRIGAQIADLRWNRARHEVRGKIEVLGIREQPQFRGQMTLKSKEYKQNGDDLIAAAFDTCPGRRSRRGAARIRANVPAVVLRPLCAVGRHVQGLERTGRAHGCGRLRRCGKLRSYNAVVQLYLISASTIVLVKSRGGCNQADRKADQLRKTVAGCRPKLLLTRKDVRERSEWRSGAEHETWRMMTKMSARSVE